MYKGYSFLFRHCFKYYILPWYQVSWRQGKMNLKKR